MKKRLTFGKKKTLKKTKTTDKKELPAEENKIKIDLNNTASNEIEIEISEEIKNTEKPFPVSGIYDPEENDFKLDMWSNSEGTKIKDTVDRIDKIKLSDFAEEMFINTILTNSYLPEKNMTEDEFLEKKLDWLIKNKKDDLIEVFLNKNREFHKGKVIKYLVDENISKANIKEACDKINFIGKDIKDKYLERFKIICLVKSNKKNEAQLVFDILREQKLSDKFLIIRLIFYWGLMTNKMVKF